MNTEASAEGGTRISQFSVVVGDYIRIAGTGVQSDLTDEWWKVVAIGETTSRYNPTPFTLINAAGRTRRVSPSQLDRVIRHPYSQRTHNGYAPTA